MVVPVGEEERSFSFCSGYVFMMLIVLGFMDDWIWVDVSIGDDIVTPFLRGIIDFGLDSSSFLAIATMLNCVRRLNGMDMEIILTITNGFWNHANDTSPHATFTVQVSTAMVHDDELLFTAINRNGCGTKSKLITSMVADTQQRRHARNCCHDWRSAL